MVAGLKPVAAEFKGVRGLKEGLVEEGSRGTVGKPGVDRHTLTWLGSTLNQEINVDRQLNYLSAVQWAWWEGLQ